MSEDDKVDRFATGCLANMRETILAGWATPTPTPTPTPTYPYLWP